MIKSKVIVASAADIDKKVADWLKTERDQIVQIRSSSTAITAQPTAGASSQNVVAVTVFYEDDTPPSLE